MSGRGIFYSDCSPSINLQPATEPQFIQSLAFSLTQMENQRYIWSQSLFISLTIYLTIFYIYFFVRINYDKRMTKNKCTLAPFLFNTVSLIALLIKFLIDPLFQFPCLLAQRIFEYSTGSAACLFYLTAILVQSYEWDIVSFQIYFQSKLSLQELDV